MGFQNRDRSLYGHPAACPYGIMPYSRAYSGVLLFYVCTGGIWR